MPLSKYERKFLARFKKKSEADHDYSLFKESADDKAVRKVIEDKIKDERVLLWAEKEKLENLIGRLQVVVGDMDVTEPHWTTKMKKVLKAVQDSLQLVERQSQRDPMPYTYQTAKPDKETPSRIFVVQSFDKMNKKEWIKEGKPNWWVRLGYGKSYRFINIPEVPGYKPLKVEIDLDAHKIPRGETLYLGVGPYTTGVRDEYYFKVDEANLRWFLKPIHQLAKDNPYGTETHTWHTRNYRYAIQRRVPTFDVFAPDFMATYNGAEIVHRKYGAHMPDLETALKAVRSHWKKRGMIDVQENDDELLMEASMAGLDFLPDPPEPKEVKRTVRTVMVSILENTTKRTTITKEDIWIELMNAFPEEDPDDLLKAEGKYLKHWKTKGKVKFRKGGYYWCGPKPKTVPRFDAAAYNDMLKKIH